MGVTFQTTQSILAMCLLDASSNRTKLLFQYITYPSYLVWIKLFYMILVCFDFLYQRQGSVFKSERKIILEDAFQSHSSVHFWKVDAT